MPTHELPDGADHQNATTSDAISPIPGIRPAVRGLEKPLTREDLIEQYHLDPTDQRTAEVLDGITAMVEDAKFPHNLRKLAEGKIRRLQMDQGLISTDPRVQG